MKRLLTVLSLLCMIAVSAAAQAEDGFSYSISDGEATITAYTGSAAELILPDTLGGYPVTVIGVCAFRDCSALTRVVIPEGVKRICSNAFQRCTALSQLIIPRSVTRIDTHAFYACASLEEILLHDSIPHINILAFYGCSAKRICRPDSLTAYVLTDVGYTFTHPDYPQLALKAWEDADGRRTFTVADCDKAAVSVSFPEQVTAIEKYAFFGCAQLEEIVIPEGVREIASSAFSGCTSLAQIALSGSVESIADDAFAGCPGLTILAPAGSAGQAFAQANGLAWQPM